MAFWGCTGESYPPGQDSSTSLVAPTNHPNHQPRDSPPSPDEHLMIIFYDLLLLDDTHCINEAYADRRIRLQTLVRPKLGRAEVGQPPYVNHQGTQRHIKLKKDYIPALGDSADLVVVGGRYEPNGVLALGSGTWWWTNFFLACVENKADSLVQNARPTFKL